MNQNSRLKEPILTDPAGYLREDFRFFHLRDQTPGAWEFHHHDFLKIMILIEGRIDYVIEGRSYRLAPWDIVLVDRGLIHRPEADPAFPYERIILYLSPDFLDRYSDTDSLTLCFREAQYRHSHILRFHEELRSPLISLLSRLESALDGHSETFGNALMSRLLCLEFLIELNRASISSGSGYLTTGTLDYRISGLLSYINSHLSQELSIEHLSGVCSLSPYHMMRIFKEETGFTIGSYITEKRLILAREYMKEGRKATEACYLSGFNHYSVFLRAYKKRYKGLPKDFINFS